MLHGELSVSVGKTQVDSGDFQVGEPDIAGFAAAYQEALSVEGEDSVLVAGDAGFC